MLDTYLYRENYFKSIIDWNFIHYLGDKFIDFEDRGYSVCLYFMALLDDGTTRCIYFSETDSWSSLYNYKPKNLFYGIEILSEEDKEYDCDGGILKDEYVKEIMDRIKNKAEILIVGSILGVVPIQSKWKYYNP